MISLRNFLVTCTSVVALSSPVTATAQVDSSQPESAALSPVADAPSGNGDEIIVTATRRNESILDVPLSMVAYGQESLDTQGVKSIEDLVRVTPGVQLIQGYANQTIISIRGLTSTIGAATTGVYIDDTPVQVRSISLASNFYPSIFDLERVEVLRGPQGTLFGSSAMGGAIRFITAKPDLAEFSGYARGEVAAIEGGALSYQAGGAIGGPIVHDKLGFRASLYHRRDGGYVDRAPDTPGFGSAEKNSNSRGNTVANLALAFAPTEQVLITPSFYYEDIEQDDTDQYWVLIPLGVDQDRFINGNGFPSTFSDKARLYSLKAEVDFGVVDLISNTSYLDRKTHSFNDATAYLLEALGLPYNADLGPEPSIIDVKYKQRVFTQELRLQSRSDADSRLKYVFGLFYQNSRQEAFEDDSAPTIAALIGLPDPLLATVLDRTRDEQYAVFGQADFKLIERLTVSAGVRVSHLKSKFINQTGGPFYGDTFNSGRSSETPITPKFGLEYQVTPDWMVYASAAKGFRPGGGNPTAPNTCAAELAELGLTEVPPRYKSDGVWSYEAGVKGRAGQKLTFAGSVFHIDWSDNQNSRLLRGCAFRYIDNLGSVRSRGVDADVTFRPVEGLSLGARVSYTNTEFQETIFTSATADPDDPSEPVVVRKGQKLTEPWNVSLSADYESSLGSGELVGYSHIQYDYKASNRNSDPTVVGYDPFVDRPNSTNFVSARLGIRSGSLDVSLFVSNLLDSKEVVGRSRVGNDTPRLLEQSFRPRTMGATASYRF
jgi:outer membrane receptor protein involved in Fe transport